MHFPTSILYYYIMGCKIMGEEAPQLKEEDLETLLDIIEIKFMGDKRFDYFSGVAGLILILIELSKFRFSNRLRLIILKLGEYLIDSSTTVRSGMISWEKDSFNMWGGFAHGDSAIAYALFKLWDFSYEALINNIQQAISLKAEILSGGVSWFDLPIKATSNLFYIDQFNGMQFTVIFESVYEKILDHDYTEETVTDICLSNICSNIFVMWPFLSVQKEFGYSDVTENNSQTGMLKSLFENTYKRFERYNAIKQRLNQ